VLISANYFTQYLYVFVMGYRDYGMLREDIYLPTYGITADIAGPPAGTN